MEKHKYTREEVTELLRHTAPDGITEEQLAVITEECWQELLRLGSASLT